MPTGTIFCCGAECQMNDVWTSALGGGGTDGHWDSIGSGITPSSSIFAPGGSANSFKITAVASHEDAVFSYLPVTTAVFRCKVMFTGLPSSGTIEVVYLLTNGNTGMGIRYNQANNSLELHDTAGTNVVGPAVVLNRWYLLEAKLDVSASPWVSNWRVDGVDYGSLSVVRAAGVLEKFDIGNWNTASTYDSVYVDDMVVSTLLADYPIGNGVVIGSHPNRDGQHVITTAGDIQNSAGGNISASTTDAYSYVDDALTTGSDYLAQLVTRTTSYVEVIFAHLPPKLLGSRDYTINCMEIILGEKASAQQTCIFELRMVDRGVETTLVSANPSSANEKDYRKHYTKSITTNAPWTRAELSDFRARFGFSSDASPNPRLYGILLEVDCKPQPTNLPILDLIIPKFPIGKKSSLPLPILFGPEPVTNFVPKASIF